MFQFKLRGRGISVETVVALFLLVIINDLRLLDESFLSKIPEGVGLAKNCLKMFWHLPGRALLPKNAGGRRS